MLTKMVKVTGCLNHIRLISLPDLIGIIATHIIYRDINQL